MASHAYICVSASTTKKIIIYMYKGQTSSYYIHTHKWIVINYLKYVVLWKETLKKFVWQCMHINAVDFLKQRIELIVAHW